MDRLIAANSVPMGQADTAPLTGTPQGATDGNPASNIPATRWPSYQYNAIQEELMAILAAAGITPDRTNNAQIVAAIEALMVAKGNTPGRLLRTTVYYNGAGNVLSAYIDGVAQGAVSSTFTPLAATTAVDVEVVGAGAGSAGTQTTSSSQICVIGGAGSGAYGRGYFKSGFSGATVTVGQAGGGGPAGNNGGNGGTSSFGSMLTAPGGVGSPTNAAQATTTPYLAGGAAGGAAGTGGYINSSGQSGANSFGFSQVLIATGSGGNTPLGNGGTGGHITGTSSASGYGGGAGGNAIAQSTSGTSGGSGYGGCVIVREHA